MDILNIGAATIFGGVLVLVSVIFRYIRKIYNYFKRKDIAGPKYRIGLGTRNFPEFLGYEDENLLKEFGNLVGTFNGLTPNLLIFDLKHIEIVLKTNSDNFKDKRASSIKNPIISKTLEIVSGEESILQDSFKSQETLQKLFPIILSKANQLVQSIIGAREDAKVKLNIDDFIIDSISEIIFGLDLKSEVSLRPKFSKHVRSIFNGSLSKSPLHFLYASELNWIFPKAAAAFFTDLVNLTVEKSDTKEKFNSFLDIIYQSENKDNAIPEIFASILVLKGWTRSTILAGVWELAKNSNVQEKLFKDVSSIEKEKVNFKSIANLAYLDNFIWETLRLHPTEFRIEKIAKSTVSLGENLQIEPGTEISIPLFAVHKSENYHRDPTTFNPDRFEEKTKPSPYFPFGAAGENGSNLPYQIGLLTVKLALFKISKNFKFTETNDDNIYLKGLYKIPTFGDIVLNVTLRD